MSLINLKILHPNIELVRENQGIQPEKDKIFKSNNPKNLTYVIILVAIIVTVIVVGSIIPYTSYTTYNHETREIARAQTFQLYGKGLYYWGLTLQSNMTNIHIYVNFTANKSVYFVILTLNQYSLVSLNTSLITNSHDYLWTSGNTSARNVSTVLNAPSEYLPPQNYVLLFYNPYPVVNSNGDKNISGVDISSPIVVTFEYENIHYKVLW